MVQAAGNSYTEQYACNSAIEFFSFYITCIYIMYIKSWMIVYV